MLESRVQAMLEEVVSSSLVARTGKLIEKRLGRKLEPFDVWLNVALMFTAGSRIVIAATWPGVSVGAAAV